MNLKAVSRLVFPFFVLILFVAISLAFTGCSNAEAAKAEHISRGEAYLSDKRYPEASLEFRSALQMDDKSGPAHWGLARAFEGMQRFNEAFEELRRTVELDKTNLDARVKLGNYFLLVKPPQVNDAERLANQVLEQKPDHIEATILLGNVLFVKGQSSEALAKINHAIELDPKRIESYLSLARFYTSAKEPEKAEETFRRALSLNNSSAIAHVEYGKFMVSQGRRDQAEAEFKRATEVEPENRDARFVLASYYLVNKKYDQAEQAYKNLAELDKDKPEGRSVLADFYSSIGRYKEAVDIYREIVAKSPDYSRGRYRLGELMLQSGDIEGAKRQVEVSLKANERDSEALMLRARIHMQSGQPSETKAAVEDLTAVLKQEPGSRQALYYMADAKSRLGQIDEARKYITDLERFYPDYLPARLMETQISLALGDLKGSISAANDLIDRLSKAAPDSETSPQLLAELRTKALSARASAELIQGDTKAARADFSSAKDASPNSAGAYVNLAAVSLKENKIQEAEGFYEQALQVNKTDFDTLRGLILNIYMPANKFDLAHQRMDQAIAASPNDPSLHLLKANIYGRQMNVEGSEKELRAALQIDPNYLPAISALGTLYANTKQTDRAIAQYQELNQRSESASTYTLIGILEESRSNRDAAEAAYRKALSLDPNTTIAANNLAWMIAVSGNGNLDEALTLAQGVVQRNPDQTGFVDTLGWVYQKKGLYGPAADQFQKVVAKEPANATYRFHLGMAYAGKGDHAGAKKEIQDALKQQNSMSPSDADQARKTLATL